MRIISMQSQKLVVPAYFTVWIISSASFITLILFHPPVQAQVSELFEEEQRTRLQHAFYVCHRKMLSDPPSQAGLYCNRTWDNVMCWPDTPAGTVGRQSCPSYINKFDVAEYATKQCLENGSWYVSPEIGKPWTNFSACIREPADENLPHLLIVDHLPGVMMMARVGYSLSLAALLLAVVIMLYFRRLRCPRNWIHLNMFLAFLLRAGFHLLKHLLLVNDLGFPNDVNNTGSRTEFIQDGTHWECKLFFTLFYYLILASLMWLFNEGLYLVLILTVAVFAEKTKIRWFVLIGWGVPVIFVVPWVVCRIKLDDMLCWNVHLKDELWWIVNGPMVASVVVNFAFFINIVRILFTKLTASNCPESKKVRYRKLAKSTLILIPLFAVYYMGFMWLPDDISPAADLFKIYVEMLFNSFQGFLVALLFCFLNAEVQNEIRKKWQRHVQRRGGGGGGAASSWRSQLSIGSFLHRSLNRGDESAGVALANGRCQAHQEQQQQQQQQQQHSKEKGKRRRAGSQTLEDSSLGPRTPQDPALPINVASTIRSGQHNGGSKSNGHQLAVIREEALVLDISRDRGASCPHFRQVQAELSCCPPPTAEISHMPQRDEGISGASRPGVDGNGFGTKDFSSTDSGVELHADDVHTQLVPFTPDRGGDGDQSMNKEYILSGHDGIICDSKASETESCSEKLLATFSAKDFER